MSYDINHDDTPPIAGEYLVSIGKKGVGSVYWIKAIRKVNQKKAGEWQRYMLEVSNLPEMKALTEYELTEGGANVWVRGEPAHPMFWYPRKPQKQL